MVLVWFVLGMIIDSISIMLLTAAIFAPIAVKLGYEPIAFAVIAIIAIEAGLLTPPFGLLVYTVKSAIQDFDPDISVMTIFRSSIPYWIIMLIGMAVIVRFPEIATYLPDLLFPAELIPVSTGACRVQACNSSPAALPRCSSSSSRATMLRAATPPASALISMTGESGAASIRCCWPSSIHLSSRKVLSTPFLK